MSLFTRIQDSPPLGEEPRGPGKCPTPECEELESGWSPTGQCRSCVDEAYQRAAEEDTRLRKLYADCTCVGPDHPDFDGTLCEPCVARLVDVAGEPPEEYCARDEDGAATCDCSRCAARERLADNALARCLNAIPERALDVETHAVQPGDHAPTPFIEYVVWADCDSCGAPDGWLGRGPCYHCGEFEL